ncbi:hypothetical protein B296_00022371 [Ensete ventricosum]|uniref:Uncharacterized protein n=1 Tax=Ensete ventricosum TaxID=4639 RepID=A0A426ZA94_ENSVE|nr:hypothetical protein B296_00022371 [Ensete ventricosum]
MARKPPPEPAPVPGRPRPLIAVENPKPKPGSRCAEASGETAAECAAIFCCCPCSLAKLLVFAVVKLPEGLVRKALRRRRKRKKKSRGIWQPKYGAFDDDDDDDFSVHGGILLAAAGTEGAWSAKTPSQELLEFEKEMLAMFYGAGFWRSASQKE